MSTKPLSTIPNAILQCPDDALRTRGIAAFHRGNLKERNEVLRDCIRYNAAHHLERACKERKQAFEEWKRYLLLNPKIEQQENGSTTNG